MSTITLPADAAPSEVWHRTDRESSWERYGYALFAHRTFRRGTHVVRVGDKWLTIEAPAEARRPRLGDFGFWKQLDAEHDAFDVPATMLADSTSEFDLESADSSLGRLTEWLEASRRNDLPTGWTPPEATIVRGIVPASLWSLQVGSYVRTVELDIGPRRFAVRTTLAAATESLSRPRVECLRRKLDFENEHRRWVRLGVSDPTDRPAVVAEIDLTGCPLDRLEALVPPALWALRLTADALLPTVVLLTDSHVCCESWERASL